MSAHIKVRPYGSGDIALDFYTTRAEADNTNPTVVILGDDSVSIAGSLTVSGTISGAQTGVDITTDQHDAGFTYGGKVVKVRRFTGTTPISSTPNQTQVLFTPTSGSAARLINVIGTVARTSTGQRHMVGSIQPDSTPQGHASIIYQEPNSGEIRMYVSSPEYQGTAYDIAVYYTL